MNKALLILAAALTLSAATTEAFNHPGNPPPPPGYRPGPGYGPDRGPGHGPRPYPRHPGHPGRPNPQPGYPGYPGNPGQPGYGTFSVPVYVDRYMFANDRIDISQYINLRQYQGYRLVAIDFTANAQQYSALINVLINGYQVAPAINLNPYPNNFRIFPAQNTFLGYGADSIVIYGSGNLYIRNVVLQLSR